MDSTVTVRGTDGLVLRWLLVLAAVTLVAVFAFTLLFTNFVLWDDEGYFLQAYREFLSGRVPYDEVFSLYGPLMFLSAGVLAGFDPANVTHDNLRWIWLPVWVLIAVLLGTVVWRWTGQFVPAVCTVLLVGFRLQGLAFGVGHPQLWVMLAVSLLLLLGLDSLTARQEFRTFWPGVVLGAIFLLKINIGGLVLLGFLLALSFHGTLRWTRGIWIAGAGLAGVALFLASTTVPEKGFAVAYLLSLLATLLVAWTGQAPSVSGRRVFLLGSGGVFSVCLGIGSILLFGTTFPALYQAFVAIPALLVQSYHLPFSDAGGTGSIVICTVAAGVALLAYRWRLLKERTVRMGLLKVAVGAGLLLGFCIDVRQTLTGSLLLMWLLVADPPSAPPSAYSNRLLLALLSLLFSLHLFPMAGTQAEWAALMPMTAAAVLLADGMNCLDHEMRSGASPLWPGSVARFAGNSLCVGLFLMLVSADVAGVDRWNTGEALDLPGAHRLRLSVDKKERLIGTVAMLAKNCRTALMVPGLYSFSVWSGVPAFEQRRINSWLFMWQDEVLKNELPRLRNQNQGCVLVSSDQYRFFRRIAVSPGNDELLAEIRRTMVPVATVEDMTLYKLAR